MLCRAVLCHALQAMVFAVTMNSKRNALLALMIATNFVELKGQVYKRTDTNKLWALACQVRDNKKYGLAWALGLDTPKEAAQPAGRLASAVFVPS